MAGEDTEATTAAEGAAATAATIRAKTDVNMLMLTRESMNAALDRFALVHVLAFSQCNSFPEEKEKLIGLAHKTMVAQEAQEIMRESSNAEEEQRN